MSEENKLRQSKIRKSITRKYNLGNYENVDIVVDQEHTIEWSNVSELMRKSKNATKLVSRDFRETVSLVAQEIKLDDKKAFVNDYGPPDSNEKLIGEDDDYDSLDS